MDQQMDDIRKVLGNLSGRKEPPICSATLTVNDQLMVCVKVAGHEKMERVPGKITLRSYHYSRPHNLYWYADDEDIVIHAGF